MKPAAFEYFRPRSIDEALDLLDRFGDDARVIAGGQSLVPAMNLRMATPDVLIDIHRIPELIGWRCDGSSLRIGAATPQAVILRDPDLARSLPLLALAVSHVGHVQTRSRGTIGGSLVHGDPSAEIGLVAATLDATLVLRSRNGERRIPACDFQIGGLVTDVASNELLVEIVMPKAANGARWAFRELARRHGDFALVAAAAQVSEGVLSLAVGGLEEKPRRCDLLVKKLDEARFARDAIADAISAELGDVAPLSDLHAGGEYRCHLAAMLIEDCLKEVLPS